MGVDSGTFHCYDPVMSLNDDDRMIDEEPSGVEEGSLASASADALERTAESEWMSLGELTEMAGVSVRTVRYYIAEGLLPPPEGSGPQSAYTPGHLDRLRLIQRLKAAYLPLKEIRRRLAGLEDEAVRSLLRESLDAARDSEAPPPGGDVNLEEARKYLALLEGRETYRTEPMALRFDLSAPPAAAEQRPAPARRRAPRPAGVFPAMPPQAREEPATERELWRRIALGDEAELVISDRVYARHRERVDWLVRWARKVFG